MLQTKLTLLNQNISQEEFAAFFFQRVMIQIQNCKDRTVGCCLLSHRIAPLASGVDTMLNIRPYFFF